MRNLGGLQLACSPRKLRTRARIPNGGSGYVSWTFLAGRQHAGIRRFSAISLGYISFLLAFSLKLPQNAMNLNAFFSIEYNPRVA